MDKSILIKITHCQTTTGGGKKPLRIRSHQNITLYILDNFLEFYKQKGLIIRYNGREYITTVRSKLIILKI